VPTPTHVLRRAALALAVVSTAAAGLAQRPLVTPNYYASQLAELLSGDEVVGELDATDGQNFKDGSRLDLYALRARAGEAQTVRVVSDVFSPVLSVFDAAGNLVAFADYGQDFGVASVSFVAETGGLYVVVVSGWSDYDLGQYTVTRLSVAGGPGEARGLTLPTTLESAITAEMPPLPHGAGGGAEFFSFEVAEETLLLAAMSSQELDAYLTLYDATGAVVAENDDDGYSTDSMLVALLQPGAYVIAASTYFAGEAGAYTLTLETYYKR
jgi:hypothetical protein